MSLPEIIYFEKNSAPPLPLHIEWWPRNGWGWGWGWLGLLLMSLPACEPLRYVFMYM